MAFKRVYQQFTSKKRAAFCSLLLSLYVWNAQAQTSDTVRVYFPFDQAYLTNTAKEVLNKFITTYKHAADATPLVLRGHCDAIGSNDYNDQLANQRVASVQAYMIQQGLPEAAISFSKGFGKREPLNANKTAMERQRNRRVEIIWKVNPVEAVTPGPTPSPVLKDSVPLLTQETIKNVQEGQTLRLRNINFYGGRHTFLPQSQPALDELLAIMKANPTLVIEIQGHICCLPGTARDGFDYDANDYNLSYNRAMAVYEFLYKNGIDANRMSYKGFAGRIPLVYPEYTEEDRTTNRRVEIKIIRK